MSGYCEECGNTLCVCEKTKSNRDTFTNKIGTEIFARNFFAFSTDVPNDRFIDIEYQERCRKSILRGYNEHMQ